MEIVVEVIEECWDEDPEARLSAANVLIRVEELMHTMTTTPEEEEERETEGIGEEVVHFCDNVPQTSHDLGATIPSATTHTRLTASRSLYDDLPIPTQAPPPPYYSGYNSGESGRSGFRDRPCFQSSMPHLTSGTGTRNDGNSYVAPSSRVTVDVHNSTIVEGRVEASCSDTGDRRQSNSVRNSLILGGETADRNTNAWTADLAECSSHLSRETTGSNEQMSEEPYFNSDSGFQSQSRHLTRGSDSDVMMSSDESHKSFGAQSNDTLKAESTL